MNATRSLYVYYRIITLDAAAACAAFVRAVGAAAAVPARLERRRDDAAMLLEVYGPTDADGAARLAAALDTLLPGAGFAHRIEGGVAGRHPEWFEATLAP